jgi:hypothetical protein
MNKNVRRQDLPYCSCNVIANGIQNHWSDTNWTCGGSCDTDSGSDNEDEGENDEDEEDDDVDFNGVNLNVLSKYLSDVNSAFSNELIKKEKKKIIIRRIKEIKNLAYFPLENKKVNGVNIPIVIQQPEDIDLNKIKISKLSAKEKRNLYFNLATQFKLHNTLNLYLQTQTILIKQGYDVRSEYLEGVISFVLNQAIISIFNNSVYGDEIDNYNYSQAFNFFYYFLNLNLNLPLLKLLLVSIIVTDCKFTYEPTV